VLLYVMLHRRGWFHFTPKLFSRVARQALATAAMTGVLWYLMPLMADRYGASVFERIWSLTALVGAGGTVFFAVAYVVGALDKDLIAQLRRRRQARTKADDKILEVE